MTGTRRRPRWFALLAWALLLLLVLLAWLTIPAGSRRLADAHPIGPRGPGCVRLAVLANLSGSTAAYAAARDDALSQLIAGMPANLRPEDELAVVDPAGRSRPSRSPAAERPHSSSPTRLVERNLAVAKLSGPGAPAAPAPG